MEKGKIESSTSFCITKTWLIVWGIVSSAVVIACYLVRPIVSYQNEFSVLVNAMNIIAYVLAIGVPVFLPASIVFGTSNGKERISTLLRSGKNPIGVFLRCLVEVYGLVLVFSLAVSSVLFYEPVLLGSLFSYSIGTGFLVYLPSVIIATLIVSLILASIGVIFVMITDEIIISTTMGSALTIGLATLLGWNSRAVWGSVTKGIAILSPSNLARIFAGTISNYNPDNGYPFESFFVFGFSTTMDSILLVLTMFGLIILIGFIAGIKRLQHNSSTWVKESEIRKIVIWESEHEHQQKVAKIRRRIVKRSSVLVSLIIIVLTVATIGTTSYTNTVINNSTIIFHQSPETGEQINLGDWYIFPCDVQSSQYDLPNILHYSFENEDYMAHDCPDELSFFYSILNMSSSEFLSFNETERRAQCNYRNATFGDFGGRGGAINLGSYSGSLTYVLKVIAAENETTTGFIYSRIILYQSPIL
ncbi:hypothetical protein ES708_11489 [subsurface metagenome]